MELLMKSFLILLLSLFAAKCKANNECSWTLKDVIDFQHIVSQKYEVVPNGRARECRDLFRSTSLASERVYSHAHADLHLSFLIKHQKRYRAYLATKFIHEGLLANKTFDEISKNYGKAERKIEDQTNLLIMQDYYDYWMRHDSFSGEDEETICSSKYYDRIFHNLKVELGHYGIKLDCQPWVRVEIVVSRYHEQKRKEIDLSDEVSKTFKKLLAIRVLRNRRAFADTVDELLANLTARMEMESSEFENLRNLVPEKGIAAVVAVINRGKHFDQARSMLAEVLRFNGDAFEEVLQKSYNCDLQKLPNTFEFARSYNRKGLKVILDDMEECGHRDTPIFCIIVSELDGQKENLELKKLCKARIIKITTAKSTTPTTESTTTTTETSTITETESTVPETTESAAVTDETSENVVIDETTENVDIGETSEKIEEVTEMVTEICNTQEPTDETTSTQKICGFDSKFEENGTK